MFRKVRSGLWVLWGREHPTVPSDLTNLACPWGRKDQSYLACRKDPSDPRDQQDPLHPKDQSHPENQKIQKDPSGLKDQQDPEDQSDQSDLEYLEYPEGQSHQKGQ